MTGTNWTAGPWHQDTRPQRDNEVAGTVLADIGHYDGPGSVARQADAALAKARGEEPA